MREELLIDGNRSALEIPLTALKNPFKLSTEIRFSNTHTFFLLFYFSILIILPTLAFFLLKLGCFTFKLNISAKKEGLTTLIKFYTEREFNDHTACLLP